MYTPSKLSTMAYFDKDYLNFFKELNKNNTRDWFQANKKRYENSVKKPFYHFLNELISGMSEMEEPIAQEAKDVVFRINRDIRFSKDKTPYKMHMAALISSHGKKDHAHPGLYIQASHEDLRVYSGAHGLEKDQLQSLRSHIMAFPKEFTSLLNDKAFKNTYGEILGEKNKRLPKEFVEASEEQPLLFNKNFYFFKQYKATALLEPEIVERILSDYSVSKPMRDFITEGIDG